MTVNEDDGLNWDDRIANAEKRGHFLENDKWMARSIAMCSLGEKYNRNDIRKLRGIERDITKDLYNRFSKDTIMLGNRFSFEVQGDNIKKAKKFHDEIKAIPIEV